MLYNILRRSTACVVLVFAGLSMVAVHAETRPPHVAGQFYPAQPEELRTLVTTLLNSAPPAQGAKPRILISPHAGYQYSGSVAAAAFRQVQGQAYDGVVVVGFTHQLAFSGVSADHLDEYQTPLGVIPVDGKAVEFLRSYRSRHTGPDAKPAVGFEESAHAADEHSLEVMLPFLQAALGSFKLVPILMGQASLDEVDGFAEALAALAQRGDYLFVFSTDLSHYHPYEEAVKRDEVTVEALLHETPQAVDRLFEQRWLEACGRGPIIASLLLAARLGYPEPRLLRYANSGDTAGDRSRVVGYAAIGMYDRPAPSSPQLSEGAGMALVRAARQVLERWLRHGEDSVPAGSIAPDQSIAPAELEHPELSQAAGLFVTLRRGERLRGCIGRIETDQPLAQTLPVVALEAALEDTRFEPVQSHELDELWIEVSVLGSPARLANPQDLVAGRDGVVLEHEGRRGVFLPAVWKETGWTRVEFLRELASQKAGLDPDAWRHATLFSFQDQVFEEAR